MTSHRQWTPTEMPRMRHAMVEHHQDDLDRMTHPGVRDFLRRGRVGKLDEFTNAPVTDAMFDAELAAQIHLAQRDVERYRASELFWVTRDMTRVAMDASSDIPPWTPATTIPTSTGLLVWAEPLPRLCWYGADHLPDVTADAVQWVTAGGYVDINILTRTDQLVAEGHLDEPGRRGPFVKVRGVVLRAQEPTPVDQYVAAAEPGLIAALGATWTLMQLPTVATPRQITGAGGSGRQWHNQPRTVSIIDLRRLEHRDTATPPPPTTPAGLTVTAGTSAATGANRPTAHDNRYADPPGYPATSKAHPGRPCSSSSESTSGAAEAVGPHLRYGVHHLGQFRGPAQADRRTWLPGN